MSGCYPQNTCHHVDGEFCDKCFKPEKTDLKKLPLDIEMFASFRQTVETWQKACEMKVNEMWSNTGNGLFELQERLRYLERGEVLQKDDKGFKWIFNPKALVDEMQVLRDFYAEYGHRLVKVEKAAYPMGEVVSIYQNEKLEEISTRLFQMEKNFDGFVQHMGGREIDYEKTTDSLGERLEALEGYHQQFDEDEEYNEKHEDQENSHEWLMKLHSDHDNLVHHIFDIVKKHEQILTPFIPGIENQTTVLSELSRLNKMYDAMRSRIKHLEKIISEYNPVEQNIPNPSLSPEAFGVLLKRIEKLEELNAKRIEENTLISRRLTEVERFQDITHEQYKARKAPHKCPVCEGSRYNKPELKTVDAKMSIDGVECEVGDTVYWKSICNVCEGKGIVWG
jgi:hypothetical protein